MDIIHSCLSLAPVPYLSLAFSVFGFIWTTVGQVKASKQQLSTLSHSIAQLLQTINDEYRAGRLVKDKTSVPLHNLDRLLDDISTFVQHQAASNFLKLLFTKDDRITTIEEYHRRVVTAVNSFQISALINIQHWQSMQDNARIEDQQALNEHLSGLEANQNRMMEALDVQQSNMMAMMVSLQRCLDQRSGSNQELRFLSHSLRFLSTRSGRQVELEDWMITSYEVDFGHEIGSGGFGRVLKGNWHKTEVAIKLFKVAHGAMPSSTAIRREISIWSKIRHPHILQFLGANVLDDEPFIVTPYLKNGNARDYIRTHPDCDRLKILHHVSQGIVYLHSQKIIHGDLKALNVLIDDSEKALLCDFGLSRVKADATSRTTAAGGSLDPGSRNWMAPEQLIGKSLRIPCDIYSFGMTIFELYADDIPLGHIRYVDFVELVVNKDVRPERPEPDEAPGLSDEVWQLAEQCWVKEPLERPNANSICDTISHLLNVSPSADVFSPLQTVSQMNPPSSPSLTRPPSYTSAPADPLLRHSIGSVESFSSTTKSQVVPQTSSPPPALKTSFSIRSLLRNPTLSRSAGSKKAHPKTRGASESSLPSPTIQPTPPTPSLPPRTPTLSPRSVNSPPIQNLVPKPKLEPKLEPVTWAGVSPTSHVIRYNAGIRSMAFSLDGQWIVSGSDDKKVQVWDVTSGRCVAGPFEGHTGWIWSVAFSPNGRSIASSGDTTIRVWNLTTGNLVPTPFEGHASLVLSIAFSPDGQQIASCSQDGTIRVWDARTGKCVSGPFEGHTAGVNSVAFSPDGHWVASGSDDQTVCTWDVKTGESVFASFKGHTGSVSAVAYSPNGQRIVSGSNDTTIRVWDAKTGICVAGPFKGHVNMVLSVAFSPDGRWIASGSSDFTVRVWDAKSGVCVSEPFRGHTDWVRCVVFSPDGQSIASGSGDSTIRTWTCK